MEKNNVVAHGLSQRRLDLPNIGESIEGARRYRKDRQRAYYEGFKEFENTAIPILLNGTFFKYHPNINFYVDVTKACNCDCKFCIAKVTFDRQNQIKSDILSILSMSIDTLSPMSPSIQITGGEPTLFPKILIDMFKLIKRKNIWKSVLNTNGYGLNEQVIKAIIKYNIDHVNISRHHYNDAYNNRIMDGGIDSNQLQKYITPIINKVRIQCNLIGAEIDTYREIMRFIAYAYHKLGVTNIAFADLTPLPLDSYYNQSIIKYVNNKPVDINSILSSVERDSRFKFEKYRGGVACYYEVWTFTAYDKPVTVLFKYSDNYWLEKADKDPELLPDVVLHTDGTLCGSWCKDRKIIKRYGV